MAIGFTHESAPNKRLHPTTSTCRLCPLHTQGASPEAINRVRGGPQGVYSHQTALSLHELTDLMLAKIEMTVPKTFRPGVPIPRVLRLHRDDLGRDEIEKIHGVPVTTPLRSILDLWQSEQVPRDVLRNALKEAIRLGKITRNQIRAASKNPRWQRTIEKITEGNAA